MSDAIATEQLTKVYRTAWGRRSLRAVDGLDLRVPAGSVFGFLGPNGAGKTTTIMMLLGNVRPTRGHARVLGRPAGSIAAKAKLGFLPEKFQFHEFLTAVELLDLHAQLAGIPLAQRARRIDDTLELVGLADRRKQRIRQFSKGMQQRIGLAQAILADPDLVILDEPTSALDPLGRRQVRDVILQLKQRGKTVFLNSHLLSEVELTCDEVAIIHRGRLVRQGPISELTTARALVTIRLQQVIPAHLEVMRRFGQARPQDDHVVEVDLAQDGTTPDLVAALCAAGARVEAVVPHRESLEELFVRIVSAEEPAP